MDIDVGYLTFDMLLYVKQSALRIEHMEAGVGCSAATTQGGYDPGLSQQFLGWIRVTRPAVTPTAGSF
jgi:hypothetical protein